jgi:hypothetical protein
MKKRLKMKITTVRQQTVLSTGERMRLLCPVCRREVDMLSGIQAVRILEVDYQALDRLVSAGQVHSIQTVSGNIWVCKDSLFSQ